MSGRKPRRAPDTAKNEGARSRRLPGGNGGGSDRRLFGGIAVLVAGLASLVWWSLPGELPSPPRDGHAASEAADGGTAEALASSSVGSGARLVRPGRASAELAILTDEADHLVRTIATAAEIAKRLDVRHCGGTCDAVKKFMSDEDGFEIEIRKVDDLILPPADTMDTVAGGLSPSERESVHDRKTAVLIRTRGSAMPEQMPARAAFAAAAVLAESLDGFVYDEVARRIENAHDVVAHTATANLGEPVFRRKHIVIQLYRQDDGSARLLTLGMARFGCPDFSIQGANMSSGPLLAEIMNAVASLVAHGAHGKSASSIGVTLEDVARVVGKSPSDLNPSPSTAREVVLDVVEPERQEGDPANELAELIPNGGSTRESWDAVVASLFGVPPSVGTAVDDEELAAIAKKAQRELPAAIERFAAGEGELYVKGPFPIPPDARVDGGAPTEMLWIAAASCDARSCTGALSNEPTYATNIALGKTVSVKHAEAADWLLHRRDGGTAGGESIKLLKARVPR